MLKNLINLENLYLPHNQISDISVLANCPKLRDLHIGSTQVSDISTLASLTKLSKLFLGGNQITDVSALKNLTELTTLESAHNSISDISSLTGLTLIGSDKSDPDAWWAKSDLDLSYNKVSDITPLVDNTDISGEINLKNNPLNNTALTTHIPALKARGITVEHDEIPADIVTFKDANLEQAIREALEIPTELLKKEDLAGLKELEYGVWPWESDKLLKEEEKIKDLTGLEHCTDLKTLNLRNNQISDVSALANLTNLTSLWLAFNKISDASPLSNLTNLKKLWLEGNQLSDVSPLTNLTNLTKLWLYDNQLTDLGSLTNLTNLTLLHLDINKISDITPLIENTGVSGIIELKNNPLNNTALSTHIPALKAKGITVGHDEAPADIIKMSNTSFEISLRKAIDIPTGILTPVNTSTIVDLDLTNTGIQSLEINQVFQHRNITYLVIVEAIVDLDVDALKAFTNLKSINLTNNPLSANAVLVQIPELESAGITVDLGTSAAAKVELSAEKPAIPASLSATTDITVTVTDVNGNKVKRET
ncbi:MAG: leucine-rich repeat domain-containing protein, partial [Anaerolineales bacterium]|nr:leucine-rich repeat domain-containing protein [Anaerolineales bacterium]